MSYKNFQNLNTQVSNYAPSAVLSLLTELDSLTQEAIKIASELPGAWSRSYSSVMIMKYDDQGNPTDVTDSVSPNAASTVNSLINSALSKIKILENRFDTIREQISQTLVTASVEQATINQTSISDESDFTFIPIPINTVTRGRSVYIDLGPDIPESMRMLEIDLYPHAGSWAANCMVTNYTGHTIFDSFKRVISMKSNYSGATDGKFNIVVAEAKFVDGSYVSVGVDCANDMSAIRVAVSFTDSNSNVHNVRLSQSNPVANTPYTTIASNNTCETVITNFKCDIDADVDVDLIDVAGIDASTIESIKTSLHYLLQ